MFSQNEKISEKQMRRMLILPLYASLIFVIPHLAAWLFGESIVPGLLVFFVLTCVYVMYIYGLEKCFQRTGRSVCLREMFVKQKSVKKREPLHVAGILLVFLQVLRWMVRLAFYISLTVGVLSEGQVPFMPQGKGAVGGKLLVVLPFLLVALYCATVAKGSRYKTGIEKQARFYEFIFWLLYIPFVLVLLFGIRKVDFSIFVPKWNLSFVPLVIRGYSLLSFVLPVENYLLMRPFLQKRKHKNTAPSFFAIIGTIALVCVLTLFMLGIYGVQGAGQRELLTVAIMRYIRLPFGVVERVDVLLVWFFLIGCFILVAQTLFWSGLLLSAVFKNARRIWILVVVLSVSLIIVAFFANDSNMLWLYRSYGALMDVPLSFIIPLFAYALTRQEPVKQEKEKEEIVSCGRGDVN